MLSMLIWLVVVWRGDIDGKRDGWVEWNNHLLWCHIWKKGKIFWWFISWGWGVLIRIYFDVKTFRIIKRCCAKHCIWFICCRVDSNNIAAYLFNQCKHAQQVTPRGFLSFFPFSFSRRSHKIKDHQHNLISIPTLSSPIPKWEVSKSKSMPKSKFHKMHIFKLFTPSSPYQAPPKTFF